MIESDDINSIHTAYHEAGHHLVFSRLGFGIEYTVITGKYDCSSGYVLLEEDKTLSVEQWPDYIVGCCAGIEAIKIANDKYNLGLTEIEMERGGSTDMEHVRGAKRYSDLSPAAARSKARSILLTNWAEVDAFATKLFKRKKIYG